MGMPQRRHRRSGEHRADRVRKPIQIERGVDLARRVEAHQREVGGVAARPAAVLLQQPHVADHHAAIDRLAHVVDRQQADLHGGQRFHLDAGRTMVSTWAVHSTAWRASSSVELDDDARDRDRMAQRHQLGGALGALDRGDARDAEHVALLAAARTGSAPASPAASRCGRPRTATRCVSGLSPTSTMWAWPESSKWVSGLHRTATGRGWERNIWLAIIRTIQTRAR